MNRQLAIVLQNMCRTCMRQFDKTQTEGDSNKMQNILEVANCRRKLNIIQMLQNIQPDIKVKKGDNLPTLICSDCIRKLLITHEFMEMYKNSDKNLRIILKDIDFSNCQNNKDFTEESLYKDDIYGINKYALQIEELNIRGMEGMEINKNDCNVMQETSQNYYMEKYTTNPYSDDSDDEWIPNINRQIKTCKKITEAANVDNNENTESTISNYDHNEITNNDDDDDEITNYDHINNDEKNNGNEIANNDNLRNNDNEIYFDGEINNDSEITNCEENTKKIAKKRKQIGQQKRLPVKKTIKDAEEESVLANGYENGNIPCKHCELVLDNVELWREHNRSHIIEENEKCKKRYQCEHCGKGFAKNVYYKTHLRIHTGEQPYLCFECGKGFKVLSGFKVHMMRHKEVKNYQCKECPKKFVCSSGLYNHMMVHTKVKLFVCDVCGKEFHMAIHLKKHKLYHDGIKNFKCDFCDKRFVLAERQRRHMRIHTGEKPYRCKYCQKAFSQSNDYIKHLRLHLGNNVYQCEFCPLRFPLARDLQIHFATHKDDDEETRTRNLEARLEDKRNLQIKFGIKES